MDESKNENALIAEYEWLRQYQKVLNGQSNLIDARLVEIKRQLPDGYTFPGDMSSLMDERR